MAANRMKSRRNEADESKEGRDEDPRREGLVRDTAPSHMIYAVLGCRHRRFIFFPATGDPMIAIVCGLQHCD